MSDKKYSKVCCNCAHWKDFPYEREKACDIFLAKTQPTDFCSRWAAIDDEWDSDGVSHVPAERKENDSTADTD